MEIFRKIKKMLRKPEVSPEQQAHPAEQECTMKLIRNYLGYGVDLEFTFSHCCQSNLTKINQTLSEYTLKEVTVQNHTGAVVMQTTVDPVTGKASRKQVYGLESCTLHCVEANPGEGLGFQIGTMVAEKTVQDCALLWQENNPDRKLCKKVFRNLEDVYALVVVHHDIREKPKKREIIQRSGTQKAKTVQMSSRQHALVQSKPAPAESKPEPVQSNPLLWRLEGDTLYIDGPAEIRGPLFSGIPAFRNVVLGPGVTKIGTNAFKDRTDLTSVAIGEGVREIGEEAFWACRGLTELVLPDSLREIGESAFAGCTALASLAVPANVSIIGENAFRGVPHIFCSGALVAADFWGADDADFVQGRKFFCGRPGKDTLSWHMVGDTLYIEGQGRLRCSRFNWNQDKVRHVIIAPGCTAIGDFAFSGHVYLETIDLPDTLRTIGARAFSWCTYLREVNIPDSVVGIGTGAFSECLRLKKVQLPRNLAQIHDDTFYDCRSLENVQIPDGVHYIGSRAFRSVKSVNNLPRNLGNWGTKTPEYSKRRYGLGVAAFQEAGLPAHLEIPDRMRSIPKTAFYESKNLVSVKLPGNLESIGQFAFCGCRQLECLEIPETVTQIGTAAFWPIPYIVYNGPAQSDDNWGARRRN